MGLDYKFDPDLNARRVRILAGTSVHQLLDDMKAMYADPTYNSELNSLWDMREADASKLDYQALDKIRKLVMNHWGTKGKSTAAIVVQGDLDYGVSRMFQSLMEVLSSNRIHIFKSITEAEDYIRLVSKPAH